MSQYDNLTPEMRRRLEEMVAKGLIVDDGRKPWEPRPEVKFPPRSWSPEWIEQLTPEQRQELQDRFISCMASVSAAMQPFVQALQQLAVPAMQVFATAFQPLVEYMKSVEWPDMTEGEQEAAARGIDLADEMSGDDSYVCEHCTGGNRVAKARRRWHNRLMHKGNPS